MPYFLVFSRADSRYGPVGAGRSCGQPARLPLECRGGVGDQCRLGVAHLERARAGQASAACSAPLPRLYACLPSGAARKTGGPALKTTPRGSPGWGWGCEVETCEARGLGGGLRARFPRWDTILCMRTKRPSTKKQRSSPNPSSASNAEVGGRFQARSLLSEIFSGNARAPGFFAGNRLEASRPIDPPQKIVWPTQILAALPPPRERCAVEEELDAHRFRVMHGGFCI